MNTREQMNIVVVGHVDHGKSTVIGRLLADTGSLPKGKLEQVKATCERNARPFEYAFLLDALKDEQAQGITIDTARCFFKTKKRDYIIIDAPGHVEFLKNMVSGAARAEAALLVIDAHEGIQENSKRHGYLISMLGVKQLVVVVNKMDLVGFEQSVYQKVIKDYSEFLGRLGVNPVAFIPISARNGDNLAALSKSMPWYNGVSVLEQVDSFVKQDDLFHKPFRMPVQDVYKFTEWGDDRRIIAGTVETGSIALGDPVVFLPSGKKSSIVSIEGFNTSSKSAISAGYATGFTLKDELYLPKGEIMCKDGELPAQVSTRFKANIFWMSRIPMIPDRKYKLKIASAAVTVRLVEVLSSIDATELTSVKGKQQIEWHDVAECILETTRPVAFDLISDIQATGRFVIVDNYDISGGGIITSKLNVEMSSWDEQVVKREMHWDRGLVTSEYRSTVYGNKSKFVVISGSARAPSIAKQLEQKLVEIGKVSYYLGVSSLADGLDSDLEGGQDYWDEQIRRLGELACILADAGVIFVTALPVGEPHDLKLLSTLASPHELLHVEFNSGQSTDERLGLDGTETDREAVTKIFDRLIQQEIFSDYAI